MKKGEIGLLKPLINFKKSRGDILIPILTIVISLFGILMIYSASNYYALYQYNDRFYFVKKQVIGFLLGLVCMFITSKIDYYKLFKFKYFLVVAGIVLLLLVFTPLGVENYGAKRWVNLGVFTIQPSELAKFFYIIFLAGYFGDNPDRALTFKGIILPLAIGGALCVIIMLEPNMSITMCVGMLMLVMLFTAGVKIKNFIIILIPIILLVPVLIISEPYRLKRLFAFLNPWASPKNEGYQLIQSLYALGSGGLFGVGFFNSKQKYRFLPFAESDFILSVIGEEIGFIGTVLMFLVMLFLCYRGYKASIKSKNLYSFLLGIGISTIFIIQVGINALVVTGSIPPTGLPLPLISSGNTSLIVFMSAFGILYNISKDKEKI